jgi:hypothetical protein
VDFLAHKGIEHLKGMEVTGMEDHINILEVLVDHHFEQWGRGIKMRI